MATHVCGSTTVRPLCTFRGEGKGRVSRAQFFMYVVRIVSQPTLSA